MIRIRGVRSSNNKAQITVRATTNKLVRVIVKFGIGGEYEVDLDLDAAHQLASDIMAAADEAT